MYPPRRGTKDDNVCADEMLPESATFVEAFCTHRGIGHDDGCADSGRVQAFQKSAAREHEKEYGNILADYAIWMSASDLKAKRFYFRTNGSSQVRRTHRLPVPRRGYKLICDFATDLAAASRAMMGCATPFAVLRGSSVGPTQEVP